jgi:hypothetical protein
MRGKRPTPNVQRRTPNEFEAARSTTFVILSEAQRSRRISNFRERSARESSAFDIGRLPLLRPQFL